MTSHEKGFAAYAEMMVAEGLPDVVIRSFARYYEQLVQGEEGLIAESTIEPVESLPDYKTLPDSLRAVGKSALGKVLMLKLNGGLGTSMGLAKAKSLLMVKDGLCFLDIIARHALYHDVPLVLMNSFSTQADSLAHLASYKELGTHLPLDFLQHKVPKVVQADLRPAACAEVPERQWCPPGHGDLYTALVTTGMLGRMLSAGYEYLFVSNADNLGASIDVSLLGYFVEERLPFMMEVADRSEADRKGGHLARSLDGQLVLRESAQCAEEDVSAFQDITRHRYFNTNNLWVHLPTLEALMRERDNHLGLAMICNRKTLDPRDKDSEPIYQLETAMGSAIAIFSGAGAVRVPRSRFAPVKTTSDLLSIRSDAWMLSEDFRVVPSDAPNRQAAAVDLDPSYYRLLEDMEARFPHGPPSLVDCEALEIRGDVYVGANVRCVGRVSLCNDSGEPLHIAEGETLSG